MTSSARPIATLSTPNPPFVWRSLIWARPVLFPGTAWVGAAASFDGKLFVAGHESAGGGTAAAVWSSADGTRWQRATVESGAFADAEIQHLLVVNGTLVAVGIAGRPGCSLGCDGGSPALWTSVDGISWSRVADASAFGRARIRGAATNGSLIVAVGDRGWSSPEIWLSNDGVTWARESLDATQFDEAHFSSVAATGAGFAIGGQVGGSEPTSGIGEPKPSLPAVWVSTDARVWKRATVEGALQPGGTAGAIYAGQDGLIADGVDNGQGPRIGSAWSSRDGNSWRADARLVPGKSVTSNGRTIVAATSDEGSAIKLWSSTNGKSWTRLRSVGGTSTLPGAEGDERALPIAYLVQAVDNGVIVVGDFTSGSPPQLPIWFARAL